MGRFRLQKVLVQIPAENIVGQEDIAKAPKPEEQGKEDQCGTSFIRLKVSHSLDKFR